MSSGGALLVVVPAGVVAGFVGQAVGWRLEARRRERRWAKVHELNVELAERLTELRRAERDGST